MNPLTLVLCEIRHRWISFLLTCLCVAIAVAAFVASLTLLRADEIRTTELLTDRQKEIEAAGAALEDSMRKITKGLGFNILVLPEDQDLGQLHADGTPNTTMPEDFVEKLANSDIVTINHLLPIVSRKIEWEEYDRSVIVTGTRGEVPLMHRALKKPLQDAVPRGTMIVGSELARAPQGDAPQIKPGSKVKLLGREFEVTKIHEERGTVDDITLWINLEEAQEMLGMQNLVNAILALECNCATEDRVAEIREDIAGILPGTQVIERGPPALARAEARNKAKETAEDNLASVQAHRESVHQQRTRLAGVLVPAIVIFAASWIALLTMLNVRQRRDEIGILRAIGLASGQILSVLLAKSVVAGVLGGLLGIVVGFGAGVSFGDLSGTAGAATRLWATGPAIAALITAPILSIVAGWIPALLAAKTDPATILAGS